MKTKNNSFVITFLKSGIAFLAGVLIALTFFAVSGAALNATRTASSTITFPGIYMSLQNVDFTMQSGAAQGCLKYNDGSAHDIDQLALAQSSNYTIDLPYITVDANSESFYARAQFVYTFYDANDQEMTGVNEQTEQTFLSDVFATYLTFKDNWKSNSDDYYYYVSDPNSAVAVSNLGEISATNNSVEIFVGTNNQTTITTDTWTDANSDGVRDDDGVKTIKIELKVEMVKVSAGSVATDWSLS